MFMGQNVVVVENVHLKVVDVARRMLMHVAGWVWNGHQHFLISRGA